MLNIKSSRHAFNHLVKITSLTVAVSCLCVGSMTLPVHGLQDSTKTKSDDDQPTALSQLRAAMRGKAFAGALQLADQALQSDATSGDEVHYLSGLAAFELGEYERAIKSADALLADYPESKWQYKARSLKAQSFASLRNFEEAEAIFAVEAIRLLSADRKEELAQVFIDIADALSVEPDPNDLAAMPADHNKAYAFYTRALEFEVGRDMRGAVLYKQALAAQKADRHQEAVQHFRAYLRDFDPNWLGPVGSAERQRQVKRDNPLQHGQHVFEARYRLGKSQLALNQFRVARQNFEDLLKLLENKDETVVAAEQDDTAARIANVSWQVVRTFDMPRLGAGDSPEDATTASREFLDDYSGHLHAIEAAWLIPVTWHTHGRVDEAITTYHEFIEGKLTYDTTAVENSERQKLFRYEKTARELEQSWQPTALYRIGQLKFQQKKFAVAIETWQQYISQYPTGNEWADAQRMVVTAEFNIAIEAVRENQLDRAREALNEFLTSHPLDGRAAQAIFVLGQIEASAATALIENEDTLSAEAQQHFADAIDIWARLISKYPQSEEASLALYRTGTIQEEHFKDLDAALASYRKLNWGTWAAGAQARIARMTEKRLIVETKRIYHTDETATIDVDLRNIEKLTIRQYALDPEAYFRKTHTLSNIESLDIALIEPDKEWEVTINDYAKYQPFTESIEIPFEENQPGVCIVQVASETLEATTLIVRSDIDVIMQASRRELLVFVENMKDIAPAGDVKILISNGKEIIEMGSTDDDGIWQRAFDQLKTEDDFRIFAMHGGHIASNSLNLNGLGSSTGLAAKGLIYSDRPAYQPGETVFAKGFIRDVVDGSYHTPTGETFVVQVIDPTGRTLQEEELSLSEFGSFDTSLPLAAQSPIGTYTIIASSKDTQKGLTFSGSFVVQQFQLRKLALDMEFEDNIIFRGDEVIATLTAAYYWGQPLVERDVRITLPDGRVLIEKTDADGKVEVKYDTAGVTPGSTLAFAASVDGEDIQARGVVYVPLYGFNLTINTNSSLALAGEPFEVNIETKSPDGQPVGKKIELIIEQQSMTTPNAILSQVPWIGDAATSAPIEVEKLTLDTDDSTGKASTMITLDDGGRYTIRASGSDRFDQTVAAAAVKSISDDSDATKLRIFAERETLDVGSDASVQLHSRIESGLALITFTGETILSHRVVNIQEGANDIEFNIGHEHYPNFAMNVLLMDGTELRAANKSFEVERDLVVELTSLSDQYEPGAEGEFSLSVTDQLGNPVVAELSVSLVDEALFAIYADAVMPITAFFEQDARRIVEFRTAASNGFSYRGQTMPIAQAMLDEEKRLAQAGEMDQRYREMEEQLETLSMNYAFEENQRGINAAESRMGGGGGGGLGGGSRERQGQTMVGVVVQDKSVQSYGLDVDEAQAVMHDALGSPEPRPTTGLAAYSNDWPDLSSNGDVPALGEVFFARNKAGQAEQSLRRDLPDAGWWDAAIRTDEDGKATFKVTLPERTSKWRATARGMSADSLAGQATTNIITRKDFFLDLNAPRIVFEDDTVQILTRLHNLTDFEGETNISLQFKDGKRVLRTETKTISAKANATSEVLFEAFDIPLTEELTLIVRANADRADNPQPLTDAVMQTLFVEPFGLAIADHGGGTATGNASLSLELPADVKYSSEWLTIAVQPHLQQAVIDIAMQRGFGNATRSAIYRRAQDGSELLATVSAMQYAAKTNAADGTQQQLRNRARALINSLIVTQKDDGGWGVFPSHPSEWVSSSMNYWALALAEQSGLAVDGQTMEKATAWLNKQYQSSSATDLHRKATILHALSFAGKADFRLVNALYRERNSLSSQSLAYVATTFVQLQREDYARELAIILANRAETADVGGQSLTWWTTRLQHHPHLQSDVETTALAMFTLSKIMPDSELIDGAAQYLLNQRGCSGFANGNERGPSVAALSQHFADGAFANDDYELDIIINGELVETIVRNGDAGSETIQVDPKLLAEDGKNLIRFELEGRGQFAYAATLNGFTDNFDNRSTMPSPRITRRYYHDSLRYNNLPINARSSSRVENIEIGQRIRVDVDFRNNSRLPFATIEEQIPAGMTLLPDSINTRLQYEVRGNRIVFFTRIDEKVNSGSDYSYELVGQNTGNYQILPTIVRDAYNPADIRLGNAGAIRVLAPGEKSNDPYEINSEERVTLGQLHFNAGEFDEALKYLWPLFDADRIYQEREVARMILWIHTMDDHFDADRIVRAFEILSVRYPDLTIPFDRILAVGKAYRNIGEFERAWLVFRATLEASFLKDSAVAAVLEDEGQLLGSLDYQEDLWWNYPDLPDVIASYFALSQTFYEEADNAAALEAQRTATLRAATVRERNETERTPNDESLLDNSEKITKPAIIGEAIRLLTRFQTIYPTNPLADDAAFSLANAWLDLKAYDSVIKLSENYRTLYADSEFHSSFQYMIALGHFWQREYEPALDAARVVADGNSRDRDFARYILGQIYHAEGQPAKAINWYEQVDEQYPDAREAIDYFQQQELSLEEINRFLPDEMTELAITYRNIAELQLQVYRVDLMKLYLREKNLSNITQVNLAGIEPQLITTVSLGDGKDYVEKEHTLELGLEDEGAYLVIARGDNLFASGLVLITPLKIEVQEDAVSGRVRMNLLDEINNMRPAGVHVKAIGSADTEFNSGETDLRGIYVADGIDGRVTAIARDEHLRYAFYRGERWLGKTPEQFPDRSRDRAPAQQLAPAESVDVDYKGNLREQNKQLQFDNRSNWDAQRRNYSEGVEVQQAK